MLRNIKCASGVRIVRCGALNLWGKKDKKKLLLLIPPHLRHKASHLYICGPCSCLTSTYSQLKDSFVQTYIYCNFLFFIFSSLFRKIIIIFTFLPRGFCLRSLKQMTVATVKVAYTVAADGTYINSRNIVLLYRSN